MYVLSPLQLSVSMAKNIFCNIGATSIPYFKVISI